MNDCTSENCPRGKSPPRAPAPDDYPLDDCPSKRLHLRKIAPPKDNCSCGKLLSRQLLPKKIAIAIMDVAPRQFLPWKNPLKVTALTLTMPLPQENTQQRVLRVNSGVHYVLVASAKGSN